MSPARIALACASSLLALSVAAEAQAQALPDGEAILARACLDRQGDEISRADVIEAMLAETGIPLTVFQRVVQASGNIQGAAYETELVTRLRAALDNQIPDFPSNWRVALNDGVNDVDQLLSQFSRNVRVDGADGQEVDLLADPRPGWQLFCKTGERPAYDPIEASAPPEFAIRSTPEELWLSGEEGRAAGAFSLGFERTRTTLEDGTRKTDTGFSIAGTVGYRLTRPDSLAGHAYLFANYALQRDRTRPRPVLGPGERESDGDTHALSIGIDGRLQPRIGRIFVDVNLQASTVFDFANDASRARLRAIVTPGFNRNLGLCRMGQFTTDSRLRRRCSLSAEIEGAHVLRRGTSDFGAYDTYLAIGGRASFEMFLPTDNSGDDGFLASVRYRLLPVVHGAQDDIERLELKLSHRFWTGAEVGIDVGFSYTNGTNDLSFEREDVLTFGLGINY